MRLWVTARADSRSVRDSGPSTPPGAVAKATRVAATPATVTRLEALSPLRTAAHATSGKNTSPTIGTGAQLSSIARRVAAARLVTSQELGRGRKAGFGVSQARIAGAASSTPARSATNQRRQLMAKGTAASASVQAAMALVREAASGTRNPTTTNRMASTKRSRAGENPGDRRSSQAPAPVAAAFPAAPTSAAESAQCRPRSKARLAAKTVGQYAGPSRSSPPSPTPTGTPEGGDDPPAAASAWIPRAERYQAPARRRRRASTRMAARGEGTGLPEVRRGGAPRREWRPADGSSAASWQRRPPPGRDRNRGRPVPRETPAPPRSPRRRDRAGWC